jgi:replicative DNA helicase
MEIKLPQAPEVESSIIGQILLDKSSFVNISDILLPEMFYSETNKIVFECLLKMQDNSLHIDTLTVVEYLRKTGDLEKVGGVLAISKYTTNILSSTNIREYANIVLEKYLQRELIMFNAEQKSRLYSGLNFEFNNEIGLIREKTETISNKFLGIHKKKETLKDLLYQNQKKYYDRKNNDIKNEYQFNIKGLNEILMFERGDLILIGARPSMGKTAFALQLIRDWSRVGKKGLFISLEMTKEKLTARIIIGETGIDGNRYRTGNLYEAEEKLINKEIANIEKWKLDIEDKSGMGINEIETLMIMSKCEYAVIDYLGLISLPQQDTRNNELGSVSRKLKGIAKRCNVPIIALHQLSREVEKRGNKKPILSDLRDSGELEQDADVILFLYREAYYTKDSSNKTVEIDIAKYREGATGFITLGHDYQISNFFGEKDTMKIFNENVDF